MEVLRNGVLVSECWSDIGVGDILRVTGNDAFPADLVLLSSRLDVLYYLNTRFMSVVLHTKIITRRALHQPSPSPFTIFPFLLPKCPCGISETTVGA